MVFVKALLEGLVGFTLCTANISGIVTDTGTTPIAGVVVQLEKGGQTYTTGADGSFTLVVGSAGILPGIGKLLPNGLSARISGATLHVTTAEQSSVEVSMFNLNGKLLFNMRRSLEVGSHSLSFPYQGKGIYLYKVKSGNGEIVLKGNMDIGVSSGSSELSQGFSLSNQLAKQANATEVINDVIVVTKAGLLNYRCVVGKSDTSGIIIKMIENAGNVTDADNNVYQTVRIGNQVWMTENLRVTKYNDGSAILLDTSKATWSETATAKYSYYNNTTNLDSIKKYGALYNWHVVSSENFKKVAPTGWHVPSLNEWDTLENYLISKGYNWDKTTADNKIAKSLAAKTNWNINSTTNGTIGLDLTKNNNSGFSALPVGYRGSDGDFYSKGDRCSWWSTAQYFVTTAFTRDLNYDKDDFGKNYDDKSSGFSVRLLKD